MLKKISAGFCLILVSVVPILTLHAQDKALKSLVETALQKNYGVRLARVDQDIAENENTLGNAGFTPNVYIDGDYRRSIRESEQEFVSGDRQEVSGGRSSNLSGAIGVEWTIFDGFKMFAEREKLQTQALLGKTTVRYYIEQTVLDVSAVYYELMKGRAMLQELQTVYDVSRERLELEEKRKEVGTGNMLEVHRARINMLSDSVQLVRFRADLKNYEIEVNRLMAVDLENDIATEDDFRVNPGLNTDDMLESVLTKNTELNQTQIQQLLEEQNVKSRRGNLMPEVMLFGSYNFDRSTSDFGFLLSNRQYGPQFGVSLRFNLYDGGKERTAMQTAKLQAENAQISAEEKKTDVKAAFFTADQNYKSAKQELLLAQMNAEEAGKLEEIALEQYKTGLITSLEFRQLQLEVLQAKLQVVEAKFDLKQSELMLHRLAGSLPEEIL